MCHKTNQTKTRPPVCKKCEGIGMDLIYCKQPEKSINCEQNHVSK